MTTKELKSECNQAKERLMDIYEQMMEVNPKEAAKLEKIIIKLEIWQNK